MTSIDARDLQINLAEFIKTATYWMNYWNIDIVLAKFVEAQTEIELDRIATKWKSRSRTEYNWDSVIDRQQIHRKLITGFSKPILSMMNGCYVIRALFTQNYHRLIVLYIWLIWHWICYLHIERSFIEIWTQSEEIIPHINCTNENGQIHYTIQWKQH